MHPTGICSGEVVQQLSLLMDLRGCVDQRTELGVYISSEFGLRSLQFHLFGGWHSFQILGVGRWGKKEEKHGLTPGEQLGSAGKLQVEWASEVLTLWPWHGLERVHEAYREPHASYSYVHQVTCVFQLLTNCRVIMYAVLKFTLQDQRLDQPGCIDNSIIQDSAQTFMELHTCWLFWGRSGATKFKNSSDTHTHTHADPHSPRLYSLDFLAPIIPASSKLTHPRVQLLRSPI